MLAEVLALIRRFLMWWLGELRACIPRAWSEIFFGSKDRLELLIEREAATLRLVGERRRRELGTLHLGPTEGVVSARKARRLVRQSRHSDRRATVRLPAGKVLRPRIELPVAAAENLAESLAFEMDRHTPFAADDVFFDFEVAGTDREMQRLQVDMEIARKDDVLAATELARHMGLAPERVTGPEEIDASRKSFNLLPQQRRARRGKFLPRLTAAAALIAALLSLAALYTWIDRKEALLARTEARIADLRARAGEAAQQQERLDRLLALSRHVSEERQRRPLIVEILDDVSRRLPDGHWLISLSLRDSTLQLSGLSESPSELLRLIERSPILGEARFAAPVTSDPTTGKESFTALAELAREDGGE